MANDKKNHIISNVEAFLVGASTLALRRGTSSPLALLWRPAAFAAYCSFVASCSSLAAHGSTLGACCSSPLACCYAEAELLCIES
jgi:hypothetical protein